MPLIDLEFTQACLAGDLEKVKYCLTSKNIQYHADINTRDGQGFIYAASRNKLDIVNYLLYSPDLKVRPDILAQDCYCILEATSNGYTPIVKAILEYAKDNELEHNYKILMDITFEVALHRQRNDILAFLIMECGMRKSKNVERLLNSNVEYINEVRDFVENLFSKLSLESALQKELNDKKEESSILNADFRNKHKI